MATLFQLLWNNNIKAWKLFWISSAFYIVFSTLLFWIISLIVNDLYTAQFSGHINIYTYFWDDNQKGLLVNPAVIDFFSGASESIGQFYKSMAEYSLTSTANSTTTTVLAIYNFLVFIIALWWCISLWRNAKNTNSMFMAGFVKFTAVNLIIFPIYYFALSLMFILASNYGDPIIEETQKIQSTQIGGKLDIQFHDVKFLAPKDWNFDRKTEQYISLKKCLEKEEQCGFTILKKINKNTISLNNEEIEKWIKITNPVHNILSNSNLQFKNKTMHYYHYENIYRSVPSEVKMLAFMHNNDVYFIEWVTPKTKKSVFFPIFNSMLQSLKFNNSY